MKNIASHCDPLEFENTERFINSVHIFSFSNYDIDTFGKNKKTKIDDYLFVGVYKFEIPQNIEHIRSIPSFSLKTKMALAGLCRSIIVLYGKYSKFMNLIDVKKIPRSGNNINDSGAWWLKRYLEINETDFQFIKDDLKKYALFLTKTLSWKEIISIIRNNYSEGIFHRFTFEEAIFILYLCSEMPSFHERHSKNYKSDVSLYADCIAGAILSVMSKISDVDIYQKDIRNYESMSQRIFYVFLDFFESQQKLDLKNPHNYFNKLRSEYELNDIEDKKYREKLKKENCAQK